MGRCQGRSLAVASSHGTVPAGARHLRRENFAMNCRPFWRAPRVKTDKTWIFWISSPFHLHWSAVIHRVSLMPIRRWVECSAAPGPHRFGPVEPIVCCVLRSPTMAKALGLAPGNIFVRSGGKATKVSPSSAVAGVSSV